MLTPSSKTILTDLPTVDASSPNELRVSFVVSNPTESTFYTFDYLPDRWNQLDLGDRFQRGGLAQTAYLGEGSVLALLGTVQMPPPPPGIIIFAPRRAGASRLAPSEERRCEVRFPLPFCEWSEYHRPLRNGPGVTEVPIHRLVVEIECIRAEDAQWAIESAYQPGLFDVGGLALYRIPLEIDVTEFKLTIFVAEEFHREDFRLPVDEEANTVTRSVHPQ